jgi:hypothetical protein
MSESYCARRSICSPICSDTRDRENRFINFDEVFEFLLRVRARAKIIVKGGVTVCTTSWV